MLPSQRSLLPLPPPPHRTQPPPPLPHSTKQDPLPTIQLIRLPPQRIRLELPEGRLNPPPRSGILGDGPRRRRRTDQQTRLPAQEDPRNREEGVGGYVAEGGWLEERSYIGNFFCVAGRPPKRKGMVVSGALGLTNLRLGYPVAGRVGYE